MNNSIYLRRKNKLYIEKGNNVLDNIYPAALLKNIETLGFTMSSDLIMAISTLTLDELAELYTSLVNDLKTLVGAHVRHVPMYPNFPQQVMEASEAELYLNAIFHYLGSYVGTRIMPVYTKKGRSILKDNISLKVIELGTKEEFDKIFTRLVSAKSSLSKTDKADVEWFVVSYKDNIAPLVPKEVPQKENMALLGNYLMKYTGIADSIIEPLMKTATDVLRLAVAMSDGDTSLSEKTKFRNFSKKERKILLSWLETSGNITEDMLRYPERWKRLGERLHPFEYQKRFPKGCEAFDIIRNDKPFTTFNSKVEQSLLDKDITQIVSLLKTRPGEFARRLDNLLRLSDNKQAILGIFREIAPKVSNPVLLQVLTHFKHRNESKKLRIFFPKGNVSKAQAIDNELMPFDEDICSQVVSVCEKTLIDKYRSMKPLGKVYLDERLKDYTVPFALRSASKALKTIGRGSRLPLPAGDTLRFFIWWKDGQEFTDLDLSAIGLDEQHRFKVDIAYYNLRQLGAYHSGDITSAPKGASEFVDISIPDFLNEQIRYVIMSVNSFTSQPFHDLPECFAGFMVRQFPNSGEIYDPRTVQNKFDLTANSRIVIPLIIDLYERQVIWTDLSLTSNLSRCNNIFNNMSSTTLMAKSMTGLVKPNLYDLFALHVAARGSRVTDMGQADTVFATDKGLRPTDTDVIISEYL